MIRNDIIKEARGLWHKDWLLYLDGLVYFDQSTQKAVNSAKKVWYSIQFVNKGRTNIPRTELEEKNISLFWNNKDCYLDLLIHEDGLVSWFFRDIPKDQTLGNDPPSTDVDDLFFECMKSFVRK